MVAPALPNILRQHAEQAAFLWMQYDAVLQEQTPENPDDREVQEEEITRLMERLEAHLDGLRIAGAEGLVMAEDRLAEFPERGELFVVRMLQPSAKDMHVAGLEVDKVRAYLERHV
ncbi:hypothetical protein [uncultured Tateyamaria sp.]|uniref:hypothetical protein n=2 Tax=uncultured Tateyamaria sp. TaxID=455651 RepID=UPI00261E74FB|nr:hypothetical protein [uncultured Tateyamaria sp.]